MSEALAMCPYETPPAGALGRGCRAAFLGRCPCIDTATDRETALARLDGAHRATAAAIGFDGMKWVKAEQVHGAEVALADASSPPVADGADGLVTATPGLCLAIYVADCAAVFLSERSGRAIGLVHSGRNGTEANICGRAVETMVGRLGCRAEDLLAWISPCVRPPHYETNFAGEILTQLELAGVGQVADSGVCTASHPDAYYSYRRELGKTGRMLALLALEPPA